MKFAVLGAGMMGCATVYDLAQSKAVKQILVADFNLPRARAVAEQFGSGKAKAIHADVRDVEALGKLLAGYEAVLNCTQYYWNLQAMKGGTRGPCPLPGSGRSLPQRE